MLLKVAGGSESAFRLLFDHYWNNVYSVAFSFTKSPVLSEEIVQDVFLKIWLKREQLGSIEKFSGYLYTVARNHIYNALRKKIKEEPFIEHLEQYFLESSALADQQVLLKETNQLINKAVEQLTVQQRSIYKLSRNEGLHYSEIADKLGISKLTVKSHMTKALQAIRYHLHGKAGEGLWSLILVLLTCY